MTRIGIVSSKGGVGKTTLALNVGYALTDLGWRVLVVDADPQGGVGMSVGPGAVRAAGLADVLFDQRDADATILNSSKSGFDVLPAGTVTADRHLEWGEQVAIQLPDLLSRIEQPYDVVLIDTPSGLEGTTQAVMAATRYLVTPLQAEPLALRSAMRLLDVVAFLRSSGADVELSALVATMVQTREDISLSVAQEALRLFPLDLVLESFVPRDPIFLKASAAGVPVCLAARRPPPVSSVFQGIAAELETRLGLSDERLDGGYVPQSLVE